MKPAFTPGLLLLAAACSNSGSAGNAASGTAGAINGAAAATAANQSAAAPAASRDAAGQVEVRAFLDQIYSPYASDEAPGREIASFMEPELAARLNASEEGINADPFIDAQDYEPFKPNYQSVRVSGDRAEAVVRINSLGERTLSYKFVRTAGGWKIADINSPESGSLREAYGLPPLK